jgi:hypothetical protein
MATVRILDVISGETIAVRICTSGNYAYKWMAKMCNCYFLVLPGLTM